MQVKTISTAAGVNEIDFGNDGSQSTAHFYWLKNLSDSTLYVSANPNPVAEKDDVAELPAKGAVSVETDEGKIYILGAGKVEIHRTNSKFCPFDWQSSGSGGGGGSITVDSELSDTSTNPLQNKVTTAAIKEVNSALETKSDINHIHDISASGNPVVMNNLQGDVPFSEMVVSGKNLIPYPYYDGDSKTHNGITFTVNSDGTVTANGTATDNARFYISLSMILPIGEYTLSDGNHSAVNESCYIQIYESDGPSLATTFANKSFVLDEPAVLIVRIVVANGNTVNNLMIRPQLELGDTATAYEPPITGRELTVNVSGKNLLNNKLPTITNNGVTATVNDDGSVTINRTESSDSNAYLILWDNIPARYVANQKIVINAIAGQSITTYYMGIDRLGNGAYIDRIAVGLINNGVGIVTQEDIDNDRIFRPWIFIHKDYAPSNLIVYPQLELGDTATEYEPYHGSATTITPTSNPYTIPDNIRQQDGYNVISVSEGKLSVIGVQKNAAIGKLYTDLKPVAFSGSYNDLGDKPEIPTNSDITASGNPVQIDGLQGGVPFSEIAVSGKNLLTYPYNETTKTVNGITFTDNGDGTITANGTATADAAFMMDRNFGFEKEGNYFLSGCPSGGGLNSFFINWYQNHTGVTIKNYNDYGSGRIIPYQHIFSENNTLAIVIIAGATVNNLVFRPQLELGDTATSYEAPITGRELMVNVCGKNLIPFPYYDGNSKTHNGITFTVNSDGAVTANGTATDIAYFYIAMYAKIVKNGVRYAISGCPEGANADNYRIFINERKSDGTSNGIFIADFNDNKSFTVSDNCDSINIAIQIRSGVTVNNLVFRPQLEIGNAATEYEPYHGSATTITPTSNPYTIPDSIRQQEGYNVISVSVSEGELSVVGVQKNAAIKRIWDDMSMDLLFDGVTSANSPAVVDLANYKFVEIHHIMTANEKTYPSNIRLSLDSYLSSASTIITAIHNSSISTIHTEEGTVSSVYAISAAGSNMNNTKIYGIK